MKNALLMTAAALLVAAPLTAGELGMKAKPLDLAKVVQGDPVDVTDGKYVYVVEFWATWCGPCRAAIPHVAEMQDKYEGKVKFVGVSAEDVDTVEKWLKTDHPTMNKPWAKVMDYTVVCDNDRGTSKHYMEEFGVRGIPHAFIVDKNGKIVWHDHPMAELDQVIDKVLTGKFDIAAAKKLKADREAEAARIAEKRQQLGKAYTEYMQMAMSAGKNEEMTELSKKLMKMGDDDAMFLNQLSWNILTAEGLITRDYDFALKAAKHASKLTEDKDPAILDTLALALYKTGDRDKAIKVQEKAIKLVKTDSRFSSMLKEFEERMEMFKKGE